MKKLKLFLPLLVVALIVASCKNENTPETKTVEVEQEQIKEKIINPDANFVAANFEIDGMMCAIGCAKVIEKNIAQMDGVKSAEVDFDSKTAKVEYDEKMVNKELLIASVKESGETYEVVSWNDETETETSEETIEE